MYWDSDRTKYERVIQANTKDVHTFLVSLNKFFPNSELRIHN